MDVFPIFVLLDSTILGFLIFNQWLIYYVIRNVFGMKSFMMVSNFGWNNAESIRAVTYFWRCTALSKELCSRSSIWNRRIRMFSTKYIGLNEFAWHPISVSKNFTPNKCPSSSWFEFHFIVFVYQINRSSSSLSYVILPHTFDIRKILLL